MFKKLFAFSMIFCFLVVNVNAGTNNNLKAAFDDLNYALSVDWDQTNQDFYKSQMDKFNSTLNSLQAQGLTNQEMIDFTLSQLKDAKAQKDLQTALTMVQINKMSPKEAQKYVTDVMNKSYSRGASWGGEVIVGAVVLVLIVAVALIVAGKARVNDDQGCYEVYTCEDYCSGGFCYEDCGYECVN